MADRLFMARVTEQAFKYEDMFNYMKELVANKTTDYSIEERNLLSVSFKKIIECDRKAVKLV